MCTSSEVGDEHLRSVTFPVPSQYNSFKVCEMSLLRFHSPAPQTLKLMHAPMQSQLALKIRYAKSNGLFLELSFLKLEGGNPFGGVFEAPAVKQWN